MPKVDVFLAQEIELNMAKKLNSCNLRDRRHTQRCEVNVVTMLMEHSKVRKVI